MDEFVRTCTHGAAEGARIGRDVAGQGQQSTHVDANQFSRRNADHRCQRAVDAQDFIAFIMHHNEIADRVKNLNPVPIGLLNAGKEASILQRHGGMSGDRPQQIAIVL